MLGAAVTALRPRLEAVLARVSPRRVAIVLGTSTSGMVETERAIVARAAGGALPAGFHLGQQELGSAALFLAEELGITGPRSPCRPRARRAARRSPAARGC